ncbi:hypothetical protein BLNAU_3091 [Blattamonas nauphoetae]|uniref:Uncharacterized protein n=1 Tax=Blattamonas nauphoetae TaxID=2049346 RepID=A0ABQ9YE35_9EUKA|nr:hypothetical protein BLNAU_3091 [Blattamonas nauphoetae]
MGTFRFVPSNNVKFRGCVEDGSNGIWKSCLKWTVLIRRDIIFTECLIASHETIIANLTREALDLHNAGNKAGAIVKLEGKKVLQKQLEMDRDYLLQRNTDFFLVDRMIQLGKESMSPENILELKQCVSSLEEIIADKQNELTKLKEHALEQPRAGDASSEATENSPIRKELRQVQQLFLQRLLHRHEVYRLLLMETEPYSHQTSTGEAAPSSPDSLSQLKLDITKLEQLLSLYQGKVQQLEKEAVELQRAGNKTAAILKMKEKMYIEKELEKDRQRRSDLKQQLVQMERSAQ